MLLFHDIIGYESRENTQPLCWGKRSNLLFVCQVCAFLVGGEISHELEYLRKIPRADLPSVVAATVEP